MIAKLKRRAFITLLGGAAAWPLAAHAQRASRVARIGFLGSTFASPWGSRVEAFRSGLRNLGYVEGENIPLGRGKVQSAPSSGSRVDSSQSRRPRDLWDTGDPRRQERDNDNYNRHGAQR